MSLFEIDPTSFELKRENGSFVRVSGLPEVQQGVHHRVNLIRGECRFAAASGVVHFATSDEEFTISTKGLSDDMRAAMFGDEIAQVAGVESVAYAVMNQDEAGAAIRSATVEYAAIVSLEELREDVRLSDRVQIVTTL